MSYITEAFKALDALNEETFSISDDGIKKLADFENDDDVQDEITIFDMDAEDDNDLEDSYIGKVILDCCVCHSKIYKDKSEVSIDEEQGLANIDMECPYCYSQEGFKVIGEVAPMTTEEPTDENEEKPENNTDENLKESRADNVSDVDDDVTRYLDKLHKAQEDYLSEHPGYSVQAQFADITKDDERYKKIFDKFEEAELNPRKTLINDRWHTIDIIAIDSPTSKIPSEVDDILNSIDSIRYVVEGKSKKKTGYTIKLSFVDKNFPLDVEHTDENLKESVDESSKELAEGIFGKKNNKPSNTFKVIDGLHKSTVKRGFKTRDDAYNWIESEKDPQDYSKYRVVEESLNEDDSSDLENMKIWMEQNDEYLLYDSPYSDYLDQLYREALETLNTKYPDLDIEIEPSIQYGAGDVFMTTSKGDTEWDFEDECAWVDYFVRESSTVAQLKSKIYGYLEDKLDDLEIDESLTESPVLSQVGGTLGHALDVHKDELANATTSEALVELLNKIRPEVKEGQQAYLDSVIERVKRLPAIKGMQFVYNLILKGDGMGTKMEDVQDEASVNEDFYVGWWKTDEEGLAKFLEKNPKLKIYRHDDGEYYVGSSKEDRYSHQVESSVISSLKDDQRFKNRFVESKSIKESVNNVNVETDDGIVNVSTDESGKVTVTTEPNSDPSSPESEEMIVPVDPDTKDEIESPAVDDSDGDGFVDVDIDDMDTDAFDELGESYLKRVYENVSTYKTLKVSTQDNKFVVEGLITFDSGNQKVTSFVFESANCTKDGKLKFIGENMQIVKGEKAFSLVGSVDGTKFITESFNYNYRTKNNIGKSTRVYGTIRRK